VPNLKAFAVGNGVIGHKDNISKTVSNEWVRPAFLYNSRFMSDDLHDKIEKECGDFKSTSAACDKLMEEASEHAGDYYIYNVYDTCGKDQANIDTNINKRTTSLKEQSQKFANGMTHGKFGEDPPVHCGMQTATALWLNRPEVRKAIHMPAESFYGHEFTLEAGQYLHYDGSRDHLLIPNVAGGPSCIRIPGVNSSSNLCCSSLSDRL